MGDKCPVEECGGIGISWPSSATGVTAARGRIGKATDTVRAAVKPGVYRGPPVTPGGSEMRMERALWLPALLMSENFNYLALSQHKPID